MALAFLNRCGFRATSTGTGSFVVASALTGMQVPEDAAGPAVVNAATYNYFAESDDKTQWEYGKGVYTTADDTLTRATVLDNSSGGTTALSFSAAPKVFMGGPLAGDMTRHLISDESISSPGPTFVVSLPAGYSEFEIFARGVVAGAVTSAPASFNFSLGGLAGGTVLDGGTYPIVEDDVITTKIRLLIQGDAMASWVEAVIQTDGAGASVGPGFNYESHSGAASDPLSFPFSVTFTMYDNGENDVNMTAGRFLLYGTPIPA
jgi:hypothetical protein